MTAAIAPGLHRLERVWGVNVYLWRPDAGPDRNSELVLFDCAWPWSGRALAADLEALGCRAADMRAIAITHCDVDHAGRLASLAAVSGAEVIAHEREAGRTASRRWRPLRGAGRSLDPAVVGAPLLNWIWPPRPVTVTRPIKDGDEIGGGWVAVHTPGHTPGHTAYWQAGLRVLIAGDALGSMRGGRLRLPKRVYAEDWDAALSSVRKLARLEPEVICFGHGPELHGAAEALHKLAAAM